MTTSRYLAHSANAAGHTHALKDHLACVSKLAQAFLKGFPGSEEAALAGLLHDLGKYGDRFQARLQGKDCGLDHWSQGAWLALTEYKALAAALAIQGHHIGLQYLSKDGCRGFDLKKLTQNHPLQLSLSSNRLDELKNRLAADGISPNQPQDTVCGTDLSSRIGRMLDIRLLFSTLVDADFLDTEAHFEGGQASKCYRRPGPPLQSESALTLLLSHVERLQAGTQAVHRVAEVRAALHEACLDAAELPTGLFTLTAPTGSGKTLAMLAFALAHAKKHGLRRVVMVIPYLSIIEQTAQIYRGIFAPHFGEEYVLEHHSLAGGGAEQNRTDNEGNRTERPRAPTPIACGKLGCAISHHDQRADAGIAVFQPALRLSETAPSGAFGHPVRRGTDLAHQPRHADLGRAFPSGPGLWLQCGVFNGYATRLYSSP